jgi:hypothetical protein
LTELELDGEKVLMRRVMMMVMTRVRLVFESRRDKKWVMG